MLNWPITQLPLTDWSQEPEDGSLRSPVEDGNVVTRRRFTRIRDTFNDVSWQYLSDADKVLVETFYRNTTGGGSLPFQLTFPNVGVKIIRFKNPPKFRYSGRAGWVLTCNFEEA